jgi:hypothetical protein
MMFILRLLFLLLVGLMVRRFLHALRPPRNAVPPRDRASSSPVDPAVNVGKYEGLTEQGIDDADFEEIT